MIRQLEPNDSPNYFAIRLEGLQMHPEAFGTGAEDWSKAKDEQIQDLLRKSNEDDFVLGYFVNRELVGVIGLKRERKLSVGHKGTVWGLFVAPKFRKQGIGRALLKELIAKVSQNHNLDYIRAVVTVSSLNTEKVFESCGFSPYGTEKSGIKEGANFFDQRFMRLNIRD